MKAKRPSASRADLRAQIRQIGLRCTAARVAVLAELEAAHAPLSHAEVAERVADEGFDRATVYRNLTELAEAGLAARVDLGDHVWRFERRGSGAVDHPHFVCLHCGAVTCLEGVDVRISPSPGSKHSQLGSVSEVLLKGRCRKCA